jgi:hypothetical protein
MLRVFVRFHNSPMAEISVGDWTIKVDSIGAGQVWCSEFGDRFVQMQQELGIPVNGQIAAEVELMNDIQKDDGEDRFISVEELLDHLKMMIRRKPLHLKLIPLVAIRRPIWN